MDRDSLRASVKSLAARLEADSRGYRLPYGMGALDQHQTSLITQLRAELAAWVDAPSDPEEIGKEISVLLASLRGGAADKDTMLLRIVGYHTALDGLPTWAVRHACRGFLKGDHGERGFCPTPPELRKVVREYVDRARAEVGICDRVLSARPNPKLERVSAERVQALLSTFGVKMEEAS